MKKALLAAVLMGFTLTGAIRKVKTIKMKEV